MSITPLRLEGRTAHDPNAPQLNGMGEIRLQSTDRASGCFTTRADTHPELNAHPGAYSRADPEGISILDGLDDPAARN
jgi:hypothetical protein